MEAGCGMTNPPHDRSFLSLNSALRGDSGIDTASTKHSDFRSNSHNSSDILICKPSSFLVAIFLVLMKILLRVWICKYISATVFSRGSEISEIGGYTRNPLSQELTCTQISNICPQQNSTISDLCVYKHSAPSTFDYGPIVLVQLQEQPCLSTGRWFFCPLEKSPNDKKSERAVLGP